MDLKALKSQMGKLGEVAKELKEKESSGYNVDTRFFKPTKDKLGNISCIIRFLPQIDFSKSPYVEKFGHYMKVQGKTFACACINEGKKDGNCPVCVEAKPFWDDYWAVRNAHGKEHSGCKEALKGANQYGANKQTVTNIMVVQNPADPDSEGKVFLYNMPKVVVGKYRQKLFPKDELDEMVIIHHPLEGRNFKLSAFTKVVNDENKYLEYDDSYFYDTPSPISEDENKVLQIMNETFDLSAYLDESKPDQEDIIKRFKEFRKFLGVTDKETPTKKVVEKKKVERVEEVVEESFDETEVDEVDIDDIDSFFEDD